MDATRTRRTRDRARQGWYARYRQWRFARYLGFGDGIESPTFRPAVGPAPRIDRSVIGLRAVFDDRGPAGSPVSREARAFPLAAR